MLQQTAARSDCQKSKRNIIASTDSIHAAFKGGYVFAFVVLSVSRINKKLLTYFDETVHTDGMCD